MLKFYTDRRCSSFYNLVNSGKPPPDECLLSDLKLKNNQKIMMMGTREEVITEVSLNLKCSILHPRLNKRFKVNVNAIIFYSVILRYISEYETSVKLHVSGVV